MGEGRSPTGCCRLPSYRRARSVRDKGEPRDPESPGISPLYRHDIGIGRIPGVHSRNLKVWPRGGQINSLATLQNRSPPPSLARAEANGADMRFLQRLFGEFCPHRFAWPRLSGNGRHYQICSICGTAYEYDWKKMQRTDRLLLTNEQHPLALARTRFPGTVN